MSRAAHGRALLGAACILLVGAALLPDPSGLAARPALATAERLDPSLRVPFAAVLVRSSGAQLAPGERVLALRAGGDAGVVAPRDHVALLHALHGAEPGARFELEVGGPHGLRRVAIAAEAHSPRRALAEQWPAALAAGTLLLFALVGILGGRHPIATPLFAVSLCLGAGIGSAPGLVLPHDAGLLGWPQARARTGLLAWCLLPAALLHLAARFPVVVPSFRRPALMAIPYWLWAIPAALAQARFTEPATVDAVERVALAASFVAGAILVAACAFPGRRLSPVERARARAAMAAFATAGAGPLLVYVRGRAPGPTGAALLSVAALAIPLALGTSVARYRLLDPPGWLRRAAVSIATASLALLGVATAMGAAWESAGRSRAAESAHGAVLALATALAYQGARSAATRLVAPRSLRAAAAERSLARATRELAGCSSVEQALARTAALLRDELRPGAIEIAWLAGPLPQSPLARRGLALWSAAPDATRPLVQAPRSEDPDPARPEVVLAVEPRSGPAALLVVAARADGLPYDAGELRALADVARLAALAAGDAAASTHLEARVAARTAELARALRDRGAVVEAASRIQAAASVEDVRAAAASFLAQCAGAPAGAPGRVHLVLEIAPGHGERLAAGHLTPERAADLQPQADAVAALANLALDRLHLLAQLKHEVARQARELARIATDERCAELVREVAHELRKPAEEIRDLARRASASGDAATALVRIEAVTHELARRLDCLLSRGGWRLDLRRVDLVRIARDAAERVARLRSERRFEMHHASVRLPLVADPVRLASLVENLLDNAAKATGPGGRVALHTRLEPGARGACTVLEVEDDGPGVPSELGDEIFEPGVGAFRDGFGLGLALCRDVAASHGGRIELESAPGRTLFRVVLPQLGPGAPS